MEHWLAKADGFQQMHGLRVTPPSAWASQQPQMMIWGAQSSFLLKPYQRLREDSISCIRKLKGQHSSRLKSIHLIHLAQWSPLNCIGRAFDSILHNQLGLVSILSIRAPAIFRGNFIRPQLPSFMDSMSWDRVSGHVRSPWPDYLQMWCSPLTMRFFLPITSVVIILTSIFPS